MRIQLDLQTMILWYRLSIRIRVSLLLYSFFSFNPCTNPYFGYGRPKHHFPWYPLHRCYDNQSKPSKQIITKYFRANTFAPNLAIQPFWSWFWDTDIASRNFDPGSWRQDPGSGLNPEAATWDPRYCIHDSESQILEPGLCYHVIWHQISWIRPNSWRNT